MRVLAVFGISSLPVTMTIGYSSARPVPVSAPVPTSSCVAPDGGEARTVRTRQAEVVVGYARRDHIALTLSTFKMLSTYKSRTFCGDRWRNLQMTRRRQKLTVMQDLTQLRATTYRLQGVRRKAKGGEIEPCRLNGHMQRHRKDTNLLSLLHNAGTASLAMISNDSYSSLDVFSVAMIIQVHYCVASVTYPVYDGERFAGL